MTIATATSRPRVLLADDYPDLLVALTRLLAPSCEIVGQAHDGKELLEAAARLQPDVIVMDVCLPVMNGLEVCRQLARSGIGARVIMISGADDAAIRNEASMLGVSAFVSKYRIGDELLPAIEGSLPSDLRSDGRQATAPSGCFG